MNFFDRVTLSLLGGAALLIGLMVGLDLPESLDEKLYYSGSEARAVLQRLDAAQLETYFHNQLLDLCLVACYTGALLRICAKLYPARRWPLALAVALGSADLLETVAIMSVLKSVIAPTILKWLGWVTFVKWVLALALVVPLSLRVARSWRKTQA